MLTLAYHPGDVQILNSTRCQKMCRPNSHLFDRGLPDLSVCGDVDHHGKTTRTASFRLYSPRAVPYKSRGVHVFPPSRCFSSGPFYLVCHIHSWHKRTGGWVAWEIRCMEWRSPYPQSSFFFDRDLSERNGPQNPFTSVARSLAPLNRGFSERINLILENDCSFPWASPFRQFDQLILALSLIHRFARPIVIVIDAIDEGYDPELLNILCNEIPKLPGSFRIFLTSRPEDHIAIALPHAAHVHKRSIDVGGDTNKSDIWLYYFVASHSRNVRVPIGRVHSYRKSFR